MDHILADLGISPSFVSRHGWTRGLRILMHSIQRVLSSDSALTHTEQFNIHLNDLLAVYLFPQAWDLAYAKTYAHFYRCSEALRSLQFSTRAQAA